MSCSPYDLCCRYHGQVVQIREQSGREHVGRITRVSDNRVWIDPYHHHYPYRQDSSNYPYRGYGYPIAIGFITGVILASLFFF